MSMAQQGLHLKVSARTVLLDLQSVRAAHGLDAESVEAMVQAGELQWVFDISLLHDAGRAELRFWTKEVVAPETTLTLRLRDVVQSILGNAATITRGELERQWVCSHVHVMRLIKQGEIELLTASKISRPSLVNFLTRRWAGNVKAENGKRKTETLNPKE